MKMWELLCVNRETGAESTERIHAETEQAAFAIASERGLMVAKVKHLETVQSPPPPPLPKPVARHYHVGEHSGTGLLYLGGAGIAAIGMLMGLYGLTMDTSVPNYSTYDSTARTHNMGLLNEQTVLVIAGSALFLGGVILLAVARIVGQLFRWGRPIVAYLETASARA